MNALLTDLLAVFGVVLNAVASGTFSAVLWFCDRPDGDGVFIGAFGNVITGNVAPISFQAETITYAGTSGRNRSERCTMIFIGAAILAVIGACGMLTKIVDFIGTDIANGMMAGVGLILTNAAVNMVKEDHLAGGVSIGAAVLTYFLTSSSPNTLVYTIVISVIASSVVSAVLNKEKKNIVVADDKFTRQKFTFNGNVILGALGMVCLNIGSNISFGAITASMAGADTFNVDHLTLISSLADMGSSFFGGAPVESIISATANAPHPVWAGVAMMIVVGIILLSGLLPKIGNYVPSSSIAGFLIVLGLFKTFILDAPVALAINPAVGGTALVVTAISNPFLGMLAGIMTRVLGL